MTRNLRPFESRVSVAADNHQRSLSFMFFVFLMIFVFIFVSFCSVLIVLLLHCDTTGLNPDKTLSFFFQKILQITKITTTKNEILFFFFDSFTIRIL